MTLSLDSLSEQKQNATLRVCTLGLFEVERDDKLVSDAEWKRDIAVQLFQYFITVRNEHALHKAVIIDRLWGETNEKSANRNFKAALHNLTKVIEPDKTLRTEPEFIIRQGLSYRLDTNKMWIDVDALDNYIILGNKLLVSDPEDATIAYEEAVKLYRGIFLPNRIYEDWCADERERIQVLVLGAMMSLAKLKLADNPNETIRLAKKALSIDATWEDAYRLQMEAYMLEGNRPLAVKTYRKCHNILKEEFEIEPLPETKRLFQKISAAT